MTAARRRLPRLPVTMVGKRLNYETVGNRVFAGKVLAFTPAAGGQRFLSATRALCRDAFSTKTPTTAHRLYDKTEFFDRAAAAQKTFNNDYFKNLFREWLADIGIDSEGLYWDTLGLRIAPPVATHGGGFRSVTKVHRDTWGSAIPAQINWWAPIWQLAAGRTMIFYPDYWRRPLANTTAEWSFEEFLASRKLAKQQSAGKAADYPAAPRASEEPNSAAAAVLIKCGELLCFSSAQLHASMPNQTPLSRFSLEIRTVAAEDIRRQRGAPNIDDASRVPLWRLFRSADDATRLSEALPPIKSTP